MATVRHRPPIVGGALAAACVLLAGCSRLVLVTPLDPAASGWIADGGSAARLGRVADSLRPPLVDVWTFDVAAGVGPGSPVVFDSVVFLGTLRGEVYALNARTGKPLGRASLGSAISGSPAVRRSLLIVGTSSPDESVVAYDLLEGTVRWKKSLADVEVTPLLFAGRVFVGTTAGTFHCLDRENGGEIWRYALPSNAARKGIRSSPAAAGGAVVFGADDGDVTALDAESGRLLWRYATGHPVVAPPAIDDSVVVVGTLGGTIHAISLRSGFEQWTRETGVPIRAGAVHLPDGPVVVTATGEATLYDRASGDVCWSTAITGPVNATPIAVGAHVYVGTLRGELVALRTADGGIAWRTQLPGRMKSAPAFSGGTLFIATDDRSLTAYREAVQ